MFNALTVDALFNSRVVFWSRLNGRTFNDEIHLNVPFDIFYTRTIFFILLLFCFFFLLCLNMYGLSHNKYETSSRFLVAHSYFISNATLSRYTHTHTHCKVSIDDFRFSSDWLEERSFSLLAIYAQRKSYTYTHTHIDTFNLIHQLLIHFAVALRSVIDSKFLDRNNCDG